MYNDGLYGDEYGDPSGESAYSDSALAEGPEPDYDVGYEEGFEEEGVYEADYRVIVPPSKPLDDDEAY